MKSALGYNVLIEKKLEARWVLKMKIILGFDFSG